MLRLLLLILLLSSKVMADNTDSTASTKVTDKSTPGIAIQVGMGGLYGGDGGVSIEYQFVLNPEVRLTPLVSLGSVSSGPDSTKWDLGYCFGVDAEFGKMHRFFIGPIFGTLFIDEGKDKDSVQIINTVVGPTLVAGCKWITRCGFLWELSAGIGYQMNNKVEHNGEGGISASLAPMFDLGIGYKF